MADDLYPPLIRDLPQADVPFQGVKAWLLQGQDRQVVFFDMPDAGEIPEHSHGEQWGVVLEGEMEFTIGGVTHHFRKGDVYHIPAGTPHSGTHQGHLKVLDLFGDAHRYQPLA